VSLAGEEIEGRDLTESRSTYLIFVGFGMRGDILMMPKRARLN
jgi:hypothetical protein